MATYSTFTASQQITKTGVGYYFSNLHICCTRGDKVLAFDDIGILSLSLDGGRTFGITLDLTGVCNIITRAKIYANGNIMFANHTVCYYSTDNLATYHESTLVALGGGAFTPSTYDNFKTLQEDLPVIINGNEIDVWGNYSIETGTADVNINAWYTIDSGITIKSCFKAGVSLSSQAFRHIHSINFNSSDNSFWMLTGDGIASASDCRWNKGTYNWGTDTWTWANIMSGDINSYHKDVGMFYYNGNVYWAADSSIAAKQGIWRCPYSGIADTAQYVRILTLTVNVQAFIMDNNGVMIVTLNSSKVIYYSLDYGVTWNTETLVGGPALNVASAGSYVTISPKNADGYYKLDIFKTGDYNTELRNICKGAVLMLRVK